MNHTDPLGVLIERWRDERVSLLPGEPPATVIAAFRTLGVHPTDDVIALYGRVSGMEMPDNALWYLWPLGEIAKGDDQLNAAERGVVFSDYCLSCWEYRLRPNSTGGSAVYIHEASPSTLIAPSLDAFFAMFVADARALLCER